MTTTIRPPQMSNENNDTPFFSLIIPVYNVEPYIRRCLDSILTQSYSAWEAILVDDGSIDASGAICDEYAARDPRFRVFHKPNGGVSTARNLALDNAHGRWIWFIDSDDYIIAGALDYFKKIIEISSCDTIFTGDKEYTGAQTDYVTYEKTQFLQTHICYCNPLMIFNMSIIDNHKIRFTTGMKMAEDLEFQYKYLLHVQHPVAIDYIFYVIQRREDSASQCEQAVINDFKCSELLLNNIADYIGALNITEAQWIETRVSDRLKAYLQSAAKLKHVDWNDVKKTFTCIISKYEHLGFKHLTTGSLRLAAFNVRLYALFFKIFIKLKR